MPDFEEMYYKMVRASEVAIRAIIEAQQACEELYIACGEGDISQDAPLLNPCHPEALATKDPHLGLQLVASE